MRRLAVGLLFFCALSEAEPRRGPLCFEPNRGQFDEGSVMAADQKRWQALFQAGGLDLRMKRLVGDPGPSIVAEAAQRRPRKRAVDPRPGSFRIRFGRSAPELEQRRRGETNYFHGRDPSGWKLEVPHYGRVRYRNVWPGIDLVFGGQEDEIICEVEVSRTGDPGAVALEFAGVTHFERDAGGGMRIEAAWGVFRQRAPRRIGGRAIAGSYRRAGAGRVVFVERDAAAD